jgi:adenine/guanine phosphoribosyltransferase-like PRPP-binding protein
LEQALPDVAPPGVAVLILDVVNTGTTVRQVARRLHEARVPMATRAFAVMADDDAPDFGDGDPFTLENFIVVHTEKVAEDACPQCEIGLEHTNPLEERFVRLRSYDLWDMFLQAPWEPEPYGPTGLKLFDEAPGMGWIFQEYGDYLAYKIEVLLDSLPVRGELVFVSPDESRINQLMEKLAPRFHDRFVAVRVPREVFERQTDDSGSAQDRAGWRKQLEHLARAEAASAVIIDEFNASSGTATNLVKLLRAHGVEPVAYVPIVNRHEEAASIDGVNVYPLYQIPSPRSRSGTG